MTDLTRTPIEIILITVVIAAVIMFLSGVEFLMLKYGTQIVIGGFLIFVGWIAHGAFKNKK
ncbi:MAG: hypothetical protein ACOYB0_10315 [Polynucleobacter sp.]